MEELSCFSGVGCATSCFGGAASNPSKIEELTGSFTTGDFIGFGGIASNESNIDEGVSDCRGFFGAGSKESNIDDETLPTPVLPVWLPLRSIASVWLDLVSSLSSRSSSVVFCSSILVDTKSTPRLVKARETKRADAHLDLTLAFIDFTKKGHETKLITEFAFLSTLSLADPGVELLGDAKFVERPGWTIVGLSSKRKSNARGNKASLVRTRSFSLNS
jgi:hypothetical protein